LIIAQRRDHVRRLERELADRYCRALIGRELDVMVEGEDPNRPGYALGTSCRYIPVSFAGFVPAMRGRRTQVAIHGLADGVLQGAPSEQTRDRLALPLA